MEKLFITELNKYNLKYVKIENENSLEKIYNLFKNIFKNIFNEEPTTDIEYFYYGVYYQYTEKNYDLMKKYYLMAIELNDSNAMNNLGYYYQYIEKNYDLMKKYYLMAIELNKYYAMHYLARYYEVIEKNYDLMKKYYLMAIELNHSNAMFNLCWYYEFIEKNDQTFVELYKYEDKKILIDLFNVKFNKFENNINLDQKYYYSFLQWKSEEISDKVKIKQDILRKTGIFPKNYNEKYLNHFNIIVNLKNTIDTKLPKDILNLIAGHLFI